MTRNIEVERDYRLHLKEYKGTCVFCVLEQASPREIIERGISFLIVVNMYPYIEWDGRKVSKHYMILPKRHVESIAEFTTSESMEYMKLLMKYEAYNFSLYVRAKQNGTRSIAHQHTHLIQTGDKAVLN